MHIVMQIGSTLLKTDVHSIGGCVILFGQNLISWHSKKQPIISRSSIEVEYKAIANIISKIIWQSPLS